MKNKKGFTLVELLAVIVILAVILIIAIPQIMNTIKTTRLKTMEDSAKLIATNAEKDYLSQQAINQNYSATNIPCTDVAKLSEDYSSCTIRYNDSGVATVKLKGANGGKFDGITCTGTKDSINCTQRDPNAPEYVYSFPYLGSNDTTIDYTTLGRDVFIRWPGDTVNFDLDDNPEVCILHRGNSSSDMNCFSREYSIENTNHINQVFGETNCSIYSHGENYSCTNNNKTCEVPTDIGFITKCTINVAGNKSNTCSINNDRVYCDVYSK